MKFKNFIPAVVFVFSIAALTSAQAQTVTGTVAGRVAFAGGFGAANVKVTVINLVTLDTQTRNTTSFGYFSFETLPIGDVYYVAVEHDRYNFDPEFHTFQLFTGEHTVNFTVVE